MTEISQNNDLILDLMEVFVRHSLVPASHLRNLKIQQEYDELRKSGIPGKEAKEQLSQKYFLGIKSIEYIIYELGKNKN